jgi:hypothetical protein
MHLPGIRYKSQLFLVTSTLIISLFFLCTTTTAVTNSGWQPVNVTSWAQVDVPPGWTYGEITADPSDTDKTTLEAKSPDGSTTLQYLFDHNTNQASPGDLKRTQDKYMNNQGFCLCQDRPSYTESSDNTAMKQTYIKGTEDGAVVCSGAYPGWGRYQYALLMNGASSVSKYYDDLPDDVAEHIRQIKVEDNSTKTS